MADKERLMKVKATLKKRQPKFIRQDAHKHKRVKQVWRKPKGLHSKIKDSRKGYRAKLQSGYQTPKAVRGLDKHGLKPTIVATLPQLAKLDPKVHSVILQGGLGGRKRLVILEEAGKHKFTVTNAKADAATKIKSQLEQQKAVKKQREDSRSKRHQELEKKAAGKKAKADDDEGKSAEENRGDEDVSGSRKSKISSEKEEQEKYKVLHQKE